MAFLIYKVLSIAKSKEIVSYEDFLKTTITNNTFLSKAILLIVNSFLLIGFYVMVAGFNAYFTQELHISYGIRSGYLCRFLLCYI